MRIHQHLPGKLFLLALAISTPAFGDALLMTLHVESSNLRWQEEFVLTLDIYGAPPTVPPEVEIEGLDQFQLKGIGRNLLQLPLGKTAKWILTYTLTANQDGTFRLGPAHAVLNGRRFSSNTLFITVQRPLKTERPKPPAPPPPPVVHTPAEIGEKVLLLMEGQKTKTFRTEGFVVSLRMLSQLPVENLRFKSEADFPGFLKYDFPFSSRPMAQWTKYRNQKYASYDLQKFLVFPLKAGDFVLPKVVCDLKVRIPTGAYPAADPILDITRSSNSINLRVSPLPPSAIVGNFVLKQQIVSDLPQSKIVRLLLEGEGLLSTFDFPDFGSSQFESRTLSSSTTAQLLAGKLKSKKTIELEIRPASARTRSVQFPEVQIRQLDAATEHFATLRLPPVSFEFTPVIPPPPSPVPLPEVQDIYTYPALIAAGLSSAMLFLSLTVPRRKKRTPKLRRLFRKKKSSLQISKRSALVLYQQIQAELADEDERGAEVSLIVRQHLLDKDWKKLKPAFEKLEWIAFSPTRSHTLTFGELKKVCERVEKRWS